MRLLHQTTSTITAAYRTGFENFSVVEDAFIQIIYKLSGKKATHNLQRM